MKVSVFLTCEVDEPIAFSANFVKLLNIESLPPLGTEMHFEIHPSGEGVFSKVIRISWQEEQGFYVYLQTCHPFNSCKFEDFCELMSNAGFMSDAEWSRLQREGGNVVVA